MRPAFFDSPEYKKKQAYIVRRNWQKGVYKFLVKKVQRNCLNSHCINSFVVPPSDKQKYCGPTCGNTAKRVREKGREFCLTCSNLIVRRNAYKFCTLKCQAKYNYIDYIHKWKKGLVNGVTGITTRNLSHYIRRYLFEKYSNKCSICGWSQVNPITKAVPIEIDHIDGNPENNKEENLRLICPNCHSLTPYFRNLNKGNGRAWRIKYLKKQSLLFNSSLEPSTLLK